jgi:hypothetical protein
LKVCLGEWQRWRKGEEGDNSKRQMMAMAVQSVAQLMRSEPRNNATHKGSAIQLIVLLSKQMLE